MGSDFEGDWKVNLQAQMDPTKEWYHPVLRLIKLMHASVDALH